MKAVIPQRHKFIDDTKVVVELPMNLAVLLLHNFAIIPNAHVHISVIGLHKGDAAESDAAESDDAAESERRVFYKEIDFAPFTHLQSCKLKAAKAYGWIDEKLKHDLELDQARELQFQAHAMTVTLRSKKSKIWCVSKNISSVLLSLPLVFHHVTCKLLFAICRTEDT